MSIIKRVTYLKGLTEGLGLGKNTKEERLMHVIMEILEEISMELAELKEDVIALDEDLTELAREVEDLEEAFHEEEEADICPCPPVTAAVNPYNHPSPSRKAAEPPKSTFYSVSCPRCANEITVDNDVLNLGAIDCPNCSEKLEFDLDDID